jgi:hypothetical protein
MAKNNMNEMESKESDMTQKVGKVKAKLGYGIWTVNFPGVGNKTYLPGNEFELDPTDPAELKALLNIIKMVNTNIEQRKLNRYIRKKSPNDPESETVYRFTILSGLENLPEVLQKHRFTADGFFTKEEEMAIKKLCPEYVLKKPKQSNVIGG